MKNILMFVLFLTIVLACNKKEMKHSKKNYEVTVNDSIVINQEGLNTVSMHDSLIYITNAYTNEINEFDIHGKKRKTFGRTGKGPGEFSAIALIAVSDSIIAVSDNADQTIKCFDKDGLYTYNLKTNNYGVYMYSALGFVEDTLFYEQHSINQESGNMVECVSLGYFDIHQRNVIINQKKYNIKQEEKNPLEKYCYFYPFKDSFVKEINEDEIEYCGIVKSIKAILLSNVTQDIKDFYKENENSGINLKFPKYMPRIYSIYKIESFLLLLSYYQQYQSMNDLENSLYIMNTSNDMIREIEFPDCIKVSNINNIYYDKYIFTIDYENEILKIYDISISEI